MKNGATLTGDECFLAAAVLECYRRGVAFRNLFPRYQEDLPALIEKLDTGKVPLKPSRMPLTERLADLDPPAPVFRLVSPNPTPFRLLTPDGSRIKLVAPTQQRTVMHPVLTVQEAAKKLQVSTCRIYQLLKEGRLSRAPLPKKPGRGAPRIGVCGISVQDRLRPTLD